MSNKLSPSLLAADFTKLGEQVLRLDRAGAEYLHIDVMDGVFVPSISFGAPVIRSIRNASKRIFDVHLMVQDPLKHIKEFADAGADNITVHVEACQHLHRTIAAIKECGVKAGIALNPATPLNTLDYILDDLDMVLLMTVNPGFGGQIFIQKSYEKIRSLRQIITDRGLSVDIEVDGGVYFGNVLDVVKAGANIVVAGTAIFNGDILSNVHKFSELMR